MDRTPADELLARAYDRRFRAIRSTAHNDGKGPGDARERALRETRTACGVSIERVSRAIRVAG